MPWNANATRSEAMNTRNEHNVRSRAPFAFPVNSYEILDLDVMMGKSAKDKSVRRKAVPKRKQVKQQAPTIESYVRKLSKERLVEIVLRTSAQRRIA